MPQSGLQCVGSPRFRTRSLRFLLTVLGVGVGIGVVFFLVSLGFGLQNVVIGRIATSESLLSLTVSVSEEAETLVQITDETLSSFREVEHVVNVSPLMSLPAEITYGNLKAETLAQLVNPTYFEYSGIDPSRGEFFTADQHNKVIMSSPVFRLFGFENPEQALGKEIQLEFLIPSTEAADKANDTPDQLNVGELQAVSVETPLQIVGTVESDANTIFVPLETLSSVYKKKYSQVKVRIDDKEHIEAVRDILVRKGYSVIALTDTIEQLNRIFRTTQITLAALGVTALFIASIGMFNTLTISLLERTHDIGTLRAIGATAKDVWKIFLFEAFLIGLLGGLAGLTGGFLFATTVNWFINRLAVRLGGDAVDIFITPPWFILSIITISLVVGILTGFYPARRAAHLNPLEALKRE